MEIEVGEYFLLYMSLPIDLERRGVGDGVDMQSCYKIIFCFDFWGGAGWLS
jgi:hypothetical protein